MKKLCDSFLIVCLITLSNSLNAQTNLLSALPETKTQFVQSEPQVINTINWLESTPMDSAEVKRKEQLALLLAWMTNSPTVDIVVNTKVVNFSEKNPELLLIFMGGWTKYVLENSYSKDLVKSNLAGVLSVIKVYKKNKTLKKDKNLEKLIELNEKNELEEWIIMQANKK